LNMSQEFKKCLERGKIKVFSPGPRLVKKEIGLAQEDFRLAGENLDHGNYRWAIVQSYYAMFHCARALLYSKKYREKSHFCLIEGVRVLFVETGELDGSFLKSFTEAKDLREAADYYGDFSKINCKKILSRAEEFIEEIESMLGL
jgi:uncharacterized protein (UPF0332 family)